VDPVDAAALRVTVVPAAKLALQVLPQLIPAGVDVTVPVPVPARATLNVAGLRLKVADTDCAPDIETEQEPVPEQPPPLQPAKVDPVAAAALRVTVVPAAKLALQVLPQLIPAGTDVTVPVPVPARATLNVAGLRVKVADTDCAPDIETEQAPIPEQPPPLQPAKVDPDAATAVSVTVVPEGKPALQVAPQLIPAGVDVTVPEPLPARPTVKVGGVKAVLRFPINQATSDCDPLLPSC
jgi:hypothetical protein